MTPTVSRGRLIFLTAVVLLILERLLISGLALANYSHPLFNWTSVILPLTHIAVVVFLVYTSDVLIYWLVIMWGIITTGHFSWLLLGEWRKIIAKDKTVELSNFLMHNWQFVALITFHLLMTVLFLLPAVRAYLAFERSLQDFEEAPAVVSAENVETKKI